MAGRPFSDEDQATTRALLEDGYSYVSISEVLGREESVVRRWAKRMGLDYRQRPWTRHERAKALELRRRGLGTGEVAEMLDRTPSSVKAILAAISREKNLPPPAPEPREPPARDLFVQWLIAQEKIRRRA